MSSTRVRQTCEQMGSSCSPQTLFNLTNQKKNQKLVVNCSLSCQTVEKKEAHRPAEANYLVCVLQAGRAQVIFTHNVH